MSIIDNYAFLLCATFNKKIKMVKKKGMDASMVSAIILLVAIICAVLLGTTYYLAYEDTLTSVVVAFLLFVAIDSGLSAILNAPSWIIPFIR